MVFFRLLGILVQDVVKDLFRHRGQHLLAVLTLASGLLLAGGGLLVVQGLDRWVSRMEGMAKITVFAVEGTSLDQAEAQLRRDPRFAGIKRVSSQEATRRFLETTREAGLMLKSLGEPIPETLELSLRPDLLASRRAIEVGEALRARIPELRPGQFVALRFASDPELAARVEEALDGRLNGAEIKKRIQTWRPDTFRV